MNCLELVLTELNALEMLIPISCRGWCWSSSRTARLSFHVLFEPSVQLPSRTTLSKMMRFSGVQRTIPIIRYWPIIACSYHWRDLIHVGLVWLGCPRVGLWYLLDDCFRRLLIYWCLLRLERQNWLRGLDCHEESFSVITFLAFIQGSFLITDSSLLSMA